MKNLLVVLAVASSLVTRAQAQMAQRPEVEVHGAFVALDTLGRPMPVAATPAEAFAALRSVYADLHVSLGLVDSAHGMLGHLNTIRTQAFAGVAISRILDCGQVMSGSFADNARVRLAFVSFVTPGPSDSSSIRTGVVGQAESVDGSSQEHVVCSSTGYLETQLVRAARARLQRGR